MEFPKSYTLVHHSALDHSEFERAVETRMLTKAAEEKTVLANGGIVLDHHATSENDAEMAVNYPPGVDGLIPRCRGRFHPKVKIDGLALYLPTQDDVDDIAKASR